MLLSVQSFVQLGNVRLMSVVSSCMSWPITNNIFMFKIPLEAN